MDRCSIGSPRSACTLGDIRLAHGCKDSSEALYLPSLPRKPGVQGRCLLSIHKTIRKKRGDAAGSLTHLEPNIGFLIIRPRHGFHASVAILELMCLYRQLGQGTRVGSLFGQQLTRSMALIISCAHSSTSIIKWKSM